MNEEMKYFAEELEEFLRKGHKLLNKVGQNMGQRRSGGQGYGNRNGQGYGTREDGGPWGGDMGERNNWYDPRFM